MAINPSTGRSCFLYQAKSAKRKPRVRCRVYCPCPRPNGASPRGVASAFRDSIMPDWSIIPRGWADPPRTWRAIDKVDYICTFMQTSCTSCIHDWPPTSPPRDASCIMDQRGPPARCRRGLGHTTATPVYPAYLHTLAS